MNTFFKDAQGKPIFVTGLQAHNSSTGTAMIDRTISAIRQFGGNTIEAPVYWYAIEPQKDTYDTSLVKGLIDKARNAGLHLIILWFGCNKNGHPNYVPEYVKLDPATYRIAIGPDGAPVPSVSVHCMETLDRDTKAFLKMVSFVKEYDGKERTVIGIQIENEFGYANTDRDYSKLAQKDYEKGVPEAIRGVKFPDGTPEEKLSHDGTWTGEFGMRGNEAFSAWYHSQWVETMAKAAKEILDVSYIINIMLGENDIEHGGYCYNSGAGVSRMLDVWKKGAPHLDLICPDIYVSGRRVYERVCSSYAREDNALFIPESAPAGEANAMNAMLAVGKYNAVGICCFGAESTLDTQGNLLPEARKMADTMKAISNLAPLLIKYRGTGKVHAFIQDEFTTSEHLQLENYHIMARFIKDNPGFLGRTSTTNMMAPENEYLRHERGRGILIQTDEHEFFIAGCGIGFDFRRMPKDDDPKYFQHLASRQATQLNFLSVEEGHFEGDKWVVDYIRNGDESNFLLYSYMGQAVRIRMNPNTGMELD